MREVSLKQFSDHYDISDDFSNLTIMFRTRFDQELFPFQDGDHRKGVGHHLDAVDSFSRLLISDRSVSFSFRGRMQPNFRFG